jgi:cation:H+ antiporter
MLSNLFIFAAALFMLIKGATLATKYAAQLAESFHLSKYTVGFIIVAVISILPETFIALNATLDGMPSFGLGMLFGSNVADLTLLFAIIILYAGRGLEIESKILKIHFTYPLILLLPLVLGIDGFYSRIDGIVLLITGTIFYYLALRTDTDASVPPISAHKRLRSFGMLIFSMAILLLGAHFTVVSAATIAAILKINPMLIGMLVVGLGTTIPELLFSLKSVKSEDDSLAVGDILGTVLADATIVVGILAVVNPFAFPQKIIYISGAFMVIASFVLFYFMTTGKTVTKREGFLLFLFWLTFVITEFMMNS